MNFELLKDVINLIEEFDGQNKNNVYSADIDGFKMWITNKESTSKKCISEPLIWEGQENGRTPESVISTLLVHLNRYAKSYSKSAISDSDFSTQEDFIYLINLKAFGEMPKMELIKKNVHEKPVGMLIINRLIKQKWIEQSDSLKDKRTKVLKITEKGIKSLDKQMKKIRQATQIVAGNLDHSEKMELIRILDKLDQFHHLIYDRNIESRDLIETVYQEYLFQKK